jgi:putative transposase
VSTQYRKLLYIEGEAGGVSEAGQPLKPGFTPETVREVLEAGGTLPINQVLRCRVRYFTDGAVLGSKAYVEDVFHRHRERFGEKRKTGARKMAGCQWGDLCTVRRLRLEVITPPATC